MCGEADDSQKTKDRQKAANWAWCASSRVNAATQQLMDDVNGSAERGRSLFSTRLDDLGDS